MSVARVLTSTTSHKREPLLPTLEVFARLDLRDIDLNLYHILERGTSVESVAAALETHELRLRVVSGGWCDFFHRAPTIDETYASVSRQVAIARQLGVEQLRLFFGRLSCDAYSPTHRDVAADNLSRLSDLYPRTAFVVENHDGATLRPEVCREILERVDRPNVRMNFDPINFERAGVTAMAALDTLRAFVGHVHLKGLEHGQYCGFGEGDVDLTPMLRSLIGQGYQGGFSVEYEGKNDATVRLYRSVRRAESVLGPLFAAAPNP